MAETYLSSLLRPLAQRRQRALGSIDPMESAAAMDRMQGAVVSGTAQMEPADAGENLLQAGRGGGRRVPVRTAQMTESDEAPVQTTAFPVGRRPASPCEGGNCYKNALPSRYSMTPSAPVQATTVVSPSVSSAPVASSTVVDSGDLGSRAVELAGSYYTAPQAAAALQVHGMNTQARIADDKTSVSRARLAQEQANYNKEYPVREKAALAAIEDTLADVQIKKGEARLSNAQADMTEGSTLPGALTQSADALQRIVTGETSVNDYVQAMLRRDAQSPAFVTQDGKTRVAKIDDAPANAFSEEGRLRQYRQAGYAALALNVMFSHEQVALANRTKQIDTPFPATTSALNFNRRAPLAPIPDTVGVRGEIDAKKVASEAAGILVRNYSQSGAFKLSADDLLNQLYDDVRQPLVRVNVSRHTQGIDRNANPEAFQRAEATATQDADRYFNVVRASVMQAYNAANNAGGRALAKPKTWGEAFGLPDKRPVDSNDTLPFPPRGDL